MRLSTSHRVTSVTRVDPQGTTLYDYTVAKPKRQAMDKTARQSLHVIGQPVRSAAWHQVPSTYLVCSQNRGTPARRQREYAGRAGSLVELDAGHHLPVPTGRRA